MIEVYVALGSNLDLPQKHILQSFDDLSTIAQTEFVEASSLYQTKPWGILDQADFINAVVKLKTALDPFKLLEALLAIEKKHGRVRKEKNGPRTLDCDILLYGRQRIQTDNLSVPHPQMTTRAFVLFPLAEIAPDLILLNGVALSYYLHQCDSATIIKLNQEDLISL
jgi:2-amino-4-hydroxy-6-hydroxymethyldihydropteridine diphosphokinase